MRGALVTFRDYASNCDCFRGSALPSSVFGRTMRDDQNSALRHNFAHNAAPGSANRARTQSHVAVAAGVFTSDDKKGLNVLLHRVDGVCDDSSHKPHVAGAVDGGVPGRGRRLLKCCVVAACLTSANYHVMI